VSILSVRSLTKSYGGVQALHDVSFEVAAGEFLALIGPNGAGKSTCFNIINGQLRPDSGTVSINGRDITGRSPRRIARLGVGRTFQIAAVFGSMTVLENVQMAMIGAARQVFAVHRLARELHRERALACLAQVGMESHAERPAAALAYGDVKRLELAIALAGGPSLLLMDEPTAGMGTGERGAMIALVKALTVEHKLAVLFTEHSMDVVFAHADRIVVLARGRVIANGTVEEVRADPQVRTAYLGTAAEGMR
jgi:branched-chain amino acid transport system ATP-binding protein